MMTSLLEVKDLCLDYGAVRALNHVSLKVEENEIVAVLGANGAGKTSLLKAISGLVRPSEGSIHFKGDDLSRIQACSLASRGIAHVPEGRRVFSTLSVRENLLLGKYGVRNSREKADLDSLEERVYALFPILKDRRRQLAGTLSGGEQQMLAIGRALVSSPSLLLLDEPSLGLAPIIVQEIFGLIKKIHEEEKVAILLVEQNARKALKAASRAYILELGKMVVSGSSATWPRIPGCGRPIWEPRPAETETESPHKEAMLFPKTIEGLAGARVTIMGLGLHGGGLASAKFFAKAGARVTVTDLRDEKILAPSIQALDGHDVRFVLGKHELEDFRSADLVIKNPAVRGPSPYLAAARHV